MKRRTNVINYIISMALTLGALFLVVFLCSDRYNEKLIFAALKIIVGAIIAGLLTTAVHELGHYLIGKKNGFVFSSMAIWFFKWTRVGKRIVFNFVMMGDSAGYTEMVPTSTENLDKRIIRMTNGGIWATFIVMLLGIPPLFITALPVWVYCIWAMFLPIGAYFFFNSVLPTTSAGTYNDGGIIYILKRNTDEAKVIVNIHKIQALMYEGKTPSQIDESLYFDLPQLREDSPYFSLLLNYRYMYYIDSENYDKAKEVTARMIDLSDMFPKSYQYEVMTDELYNACTFDYDAEKADNLVADLEKYLNKVNNACTVRTKMAYLLYVVKDTEPLDMFYKKAIKETKRCIIKGQGEYEKKLIEKIHNDFNTDDSEKEVSC